MYQTVILMVRDYINKTKDVQMVAITIYLLIMIKFVFQVNLRIVLHNTHIKFIIKIISPMNVQLLALNMLQYKLIQIRNYVKLLVLV